MPEPSAALGKIQGKVAVVTGGSSGIGAACVHRLASDGARVIVGFNRGEERARKLLGSLPGEGHSCMHIPLTDAAAIAACAEHAEAEYGHVDVLVNSAGFTQRIAHKNLEQLAPALFNEVLLANVGGTYAIIRAFLPLLRASSDAVVVSVSSISAFTGSGSNIAYCAAKAALDTMTMSFARAFGPVRFLCVSPASVDTDFVPGRDRAELEKKAAQTPIGRVVSPEDVAAAVLACVTHMRSATGTRFVIDGGFQL
jgi:3-oxoacyl-[acyl-carrier protein] reductase